MPISDYSMFNNDSGQGVQNLLELILLKKTKKKKSPNINKKDNKDDLVYNLSCEYGYLSNYNLIEEVKKCDENSKAQLLTKNYSCVW